ncbi:MAG: MoaD/ThiS family protein [Fimbriimonadaceae bacterium]|nr:MoaD/ThiS family protein [Fimbriimonadaceae bacterium]
MDKTVHLQYFAILREQRGADRETLTTQAATLRDLYDALAREHGFTLTAAQVRPAVNEAVADWDRAIEDGDRIVFLPPVAGG